jgi:putative transposase
MKNTPKADLVINALLMPIWRRKPKVRVLCRSGPSVHYTFSDWSTSLKDNNVLASMSRRGNCWDNAVTESFFSLMKGERIRGENYATRHEPRADIFDSIELFYNPMRRHGNNDGISSVQYENQYYEKPLVV